MYYKIWKFDDNNNKIWWSGYILKRKYILSPKTSFHSVKYWDGLYWDVKRVCGCELHSYKQLLKSIKKFEKNENIFVEKFYEPRWY